MKQKTGLRKGKGSSVHSPLLLVGWGREGAKDVVSVRNQFPCDKGLDCVYAQGADSEEVLREISEWLEDNPNAQFLYIGSHGNKTGLTPTKGATPRISWSRLASVLSKAKRPITVWLGACLSTFAAKHWSDCHVLPVNPIISFSREPTTSEVMEVLKELVEMTNVSSPEFSQDGRDFSFLPEDVVELQQKFPNVTAHYRPDGHGYIDCDRFQEITGMKFSDYLDSKCDKAQVARFFDDVVCGIASPDRQSEKSKSEKKGLRPPFKKLLVRKLKKKKR